MWRVNRTFLAAALTLAITLILSGCVPKIPDFTPPTITFPSATATATSSATTKTTAASTGAASPTTPTTTASATATSSTASLALPTTQVDIYTKGSPWEYADPADMVMSPNVLGFAWNLEQDPDTIPWAHSHGARFIAEVSLWNHDRWRTLADLPAALKTAYNVDFDGQPLYIQDMVYLNVNDPAFQKWLSDFIKGQIDQGADGFVFDETSGSADAVFLGGGFDAYSPQGFGAYLAQRYSAAELTALGVSDPAHFDYKQFLINSGQVERYRQGDPWQVTFGPDYISYLQQKTSDLIISLAAEARAYAAQQGRQIVITANADPVYREPSRGFYDVLDYYTFEHAFISNAWRREPGNTDFAGGVPVTPKIKYALSQGQTAVVLMAIGEYGDLAGQGLAAGTSLVLHDFAETYANLGYFCYFDLAQAFIGMQFVADHARLRPYYAFLREHPEAFNGLTAKPEVAVITPPLARISDTGPVDAAQGVSFVLSESNIPHDVIDIDKALDYKVVVANGYAWSDAQLEKLLDFARQGGTVIAMDSRFASRDGDYREVARPELEALKSDGAHELGKGRFVFFEDYIGWKYWDHKDPAAAKAIRDSVTAWVTPNRAPANVQLMAYSGADKLVVHILNYNYDGNDFIRQQDSAVSVQVPADFVTTGKTLKLLSPDGVGEMPLPFTVQDGYISFTVPELYIWSVAVME